MSKKTHFHWKVGHPLPQIASHTERKLEVIEQYLDVYFDTVTVNRKMETLRITLVDGFCGGGHYEKGQDTKLGSPFVLLDAVKKAKIRVNANRHKPLNFEVHYYFSDANSFHIEALRHALQQSEFASQIGTNIILQHGEFHSLLPKIVDDIKTRHRGGRSLFILDQWGYSDVPMNCLQHIFASLNRPEAILTFSIDALLNYLRSDGSGLDSLMQFGISKEFVATWGALKEDENFGRATAQRTIMENLRLNSGAHFFTPFMMYSQSDKRWMLLAHLSKHQAARDKMLSVHWDKQNHFRHIGKGSLFELGFDHRLVDSKDALFSFKDEDQTTLMKELENELPARVMENMNDDVLKVETLLSRIGNLTAAQNEMIFKILQKLSAHGDVEIKKKDGGMKKPSTAISVSDILIRPNQPTFFPLSSN